MEFFKEFGEELNKTLDVPADQWSQKEINLYHLLQNVLDKYHDRYSLSQFKLDQRDIRKNIHKSGWYEKSPYKKTIDWCIDQLTIKSYQRSKKTGDFRVICKFSEVQVELTIIYKEEKFAMMLKSPLLEANLKDLTMVAKVFGIDDDVAAQNKKQVALDIVKLIEEIALFYS
jgi:hypothetical protein